MLRSGTLAGIVAGSLIASSPQAQESNGSSLDRTQERACSSVYASFVIFNKGIFEQEGAKNRLYDVYHPNKIIPRRFRDCSSFEYTNNRGVFKIRTTEVPGWLTGYTGYRIKIIK
jgi:hypothetical protein